MTAETGVCHSPAPWRVLEIAAGTSVIGLAIVSDSGHVARLDSANDKSRADARLMSASPGLLGFVRFILEVAKINGWAQDDLVVERARTLIAGATYE